MSVEPHTKPSGRHFSAVLTGDATFLLRVIPNLAFPTLAIPALAIALLACTLLASTAANAQDWLKDLIDDEATAATDFLPVEQAFPLIVTELMADDTNSLAPNTIQLQLHWDVAPDYYLYRRSFVVKALGANVVNSQLPAGVVVDDIEYGITEVYETGVTLVITLKATGNDSTAAETPKENAAGDTAGKIARDATSNAAIRLDVQYQGCAKAGLCYPPSVASYTVTNSPAATNNGQPPTPSNGQNPIVVRNKAELKRHIAAGLPVMLEISANWSAASRLMQRKLFGRQEVSQALTDVLWLRADVSDIDSAPIEQLLSELDVAGPPAFRFYQTTGAEMPELRHEGRISSEQLTGAIKAIPTAPWPTTFPNSNAQR